MSLQTFKETYRISCLRAFRNELDFLIKEYSNNKYDLDYVINNQYFIHNGKLLSFVELVQTIIWNNTYNDKEFIDGMHEDIVTKAKSMVNDII
ncbi:MAG: hypothetical protein RSE41_00420 [Clostridia bacterium]